MNWIYFLRPFFAASIVWIWRELFCCCCPDYSKSVVFCCSHIIQRFIANIYLFCSGWFGWLIFSTEIFDCLQQKERRKKKRFIRISDVYLSLYQTINKIAICLFIIWKRFCSYSLHSANRNCTEQNMQSVCIKYAGVHSANIHHSRLSWQNDSRS